MRIVTWNLGYWTPGKYSAVANRQEQWRFLLSLEPDVICAQECRPDDLATVEDASGYQVVGSIPTGWTACSAVVTRTELKPTPAPKTGPLFEALSGYIAVADFDSPLGRFVVASVHTPAKAVDDPLVSDEVHVQLGRTGSSRAWYNDVAFAALDALPKDAGFIFAGDWNTARLFDANYPGGGGEGGASAGEFFSRAAGHGWNESMRVRYPEEVRTFLKVGSAAYQNDHVFTDAATHSRLKSTEVIQAINGRKPVELSDHAPVVADFELHGGS